MLSQGIMLSILPRWYLLMRYMIITIWQVKKLRFTLTQCVMDPGLTAFKIWFSLLHYFYNQTCSNGWSAPSSFISIVCQHFWEVSLQQHGWTLTLGYTNCPMLQVWNSTMLKCFKMYLLTNQLKYVGFTFPFHYIHMEDLQGRTDLIGL